MLLNVCGNDFRCNLNFNVRGLVSFICKVWDCEYNVYVMNKYCFVNKIYG